MKTEPIKGSRQPFAIAQSPCFSDRDSPSPPCPYEIQHICQQQLEQLALALPVVATWIVYHEPSQGKRQSVVRHILTDENAQLDLPHLEPEPGLWQSLPALTLKEVASVGRFQAFVCLLGLYESEPEYVLLWTDTPLSERQQHWIELQAQSLKNAFILCRECSRQQTEIQLLEQVVRRAEHQLRNPLALISLYAENLCLGSPTSILKEQAMLIRETVNELTTSLSDLLSCGQQAKLQVAPHDLRTILTEAVKGLQPWLEQKQLQVEYPTKPVVVVVDRWQIKQVFDNLLSNAVHFSPQAGTVVCNWSVFQDEVLFEVSDQGPGLSDEDLRQAFTPFYSRRPGGTGLGLAIAKKIILDHQGRLWGHNLVKGGAQFSFTLPRQPPL